MVKEVFAGPVSSRGWLGGCNYPLPPRSGGKKYNNPRAAGVEKTRKS